RRKAPKPPITEARPRTIQTPPFERAQGLAQSDRPGSPAGNNSIPRRASAPSRARRRRLSASLGRALTEQSLDDHAVKPAAIQLPMAPMNPDFLETEAFQKGAAGRVLGKDPAGKLV